MNGKHEQRADWCLWYYQQMPPHLCSDLSSGSRMQAVTYHHISSPQQKPFCHNNDESNFTLPGGLHVHGHERLVVTGANQVIFAYKDEEIILDCSLDLQVSASLHVHGPSGPVVAQLGGTVLLPCFIESPLPLEEHLLVTSADRAVFAHKGGEVILNCSVDSHVPVSEIEEVTWKKTDGDRDILVLLYQENEIFPDSSHESYQGRVEFFTSEIPKRNFSLKLMDVRMEDKGEFVCEVHTRNMSAHTTVVLKGVGFSAIHISILVLCSVALLLALGFCGPVFILLKKKVTSKKVMKMYISLILCSSICMFVAFCLWSTEGFLTEVVACSSVSIIRPVMLMKSSPYLNRFPIKVLLIYS
ncbi:uncharacterized protein LOC128318018 [Pangasianodon hypophthalmus]|uniref:uncharacterized protein LOC128318018 n=1 Tax=Pangasianodon hypophthalmus TaxID=310915 RepID=UPI0023082D7C|nr:uncharacterized protein LOC128318018 [Pangasianodon hypophthalmus]